ncbi:MAG: NAD(P)-binding domain-containing protein, partial [Candidatus Omnitrophica bacterium]|nr:NAD(P)-binding domain-containing protein [Candidatus Omnitrophota bacterium]
MKTKIGFIGGGNMGAAIAAGILDSHTVLICEPDKKRQAYLKRKLAVRTYDVETVVERSKYIILAVKPQNFDEILFEIR